MGDRENQLKKAWENIHREITSGTLWKNMGKTNSNIGILTTITESTSNCWWQNHSGSEDHFWRDWPPFPLADWGCSTKDLALLEPPVTGLNKPFHTMRETLSPKNGPPLWIHNIEISPLKATTKWVSSWFLGGCVQIVQITNRTVYADGPKHPPSNPVPQIWQLRHVKSPNPNSTSFIHVPKNSWILNPNSSIYSSEFIWQRKNTKISGFLK